MVTLDGTMITRTGVMSGGMSTDLEGRARRWDDHTTRALKQACCRASLPPPPPLRPLGAMCCLARPQALPRNPFRFAAAVQSYSWACCCGASRSAVGPCSIYGRFISLAMPGGVVCALWGRCTSGWLLQAPAVRACIWPEEVGGEAELGFRGPLDDFSPEAVCEAAWSSEPDP